MKKSLLLGAIALFSLSNFANANLTTAQWTVTGDDDAGGIWGETLVFETQVANGLDYDLTGYFLWVGGGNQTGSFGRENFTGTLFSDNQIELIGFEIEPPSNDIVFGGYSGILAASGTEITDGRWGPLSDGPSGIPGSWSAVQSAPVPAAVWLFGSGLLGLVGMAKRKRTA